MKEDHERSPSPEPIYDQHGKRVNTRDQRAKDKLLVERQNLIEMAYVMNPQFKPPPDYTPVTSKKTKKIFIPIERFPEYNFIGLIIGPRGNTQKRMERETGCKISIRGKGSVKDGKSKKGQPGEDEPLHVLLTADSEAQLIKAAQKVRDLLVPVEEGKNEHKRQQLRELAEINGTLRERIWINPEPLSFDPAQVKCAICGEVSHPTSDCPLKGTSGVSYVETSHQIDSEYEKFLAEIGEKPQASGKNDIDSAYQEFMSAIDPSKAQDPYQQGGALPWQQPNPAYGNPWAYGQAPWGAPAPMPPGGAPPPVPWGAQAPWQPPPGSYPWGQGGQQQ